MIRRTETLKKILKEKSIPAIFITNLADVSYLSGFTGTTAYMIISHDRCVFFTDGRYTVQARDEVYPHIEKISVKSYKDLFEKEVTKYRRIMLQGECPLSIASAVKSQGTDIIVDSNSIIKTMRMIKDRDEIALIKAQYRLAAEAFKESLSSFKMGLSEIEWAAALEYNIKKKGAKGVSFETIVASGYRGAMPHGCASQKIINKDEPVIIDFGSQKGYASDYTRMIYGGNDKNVTTVINIVREAMLKAIEAVKPGVTSAYLDDVARQHISSFGYGEYFNHSLGHGVGIDVHELPVINSQSNNIIEENMIFTIEPGIYLPDKFGVRLEETVLVTSYGAEVISSFLEDYVYLPK